MQYKMIATKQAFCIAKLLLKGEKMKFSDFDFSSESYGRICILAHGRKVHFPVGTETKMKEIYKDLSVEKTEKSEDGEWLYIYLE